MGQRRLAWTGVAPVSLARRIVASVALGLGLILLLFGLVAQRTIQDSTEVAYRERVMLAQVLASRLDEVLRYAVSTLEREASGFTTPPRDPAGVQRFDRLAELGHRVGIFTHLTVVDSAGDEVWTDATARAASFDVHPDPLAVQAVLRSGERQIAETKGGASGEETSASLAVPLRDPGGRVMGALIAEIEPNNPALNLLPTGEVGNGVYAQLLNRAGQSLAGTADYNPRFGLEHQELLAELMDTHTPGYRIHEPPPGVGFSSHIVAYAPVPLLPAWGVVVEQPQDLVLAIPRQLQLRLALFALAALVLAGVFAWLDVRQVVQPLRHLTAAAQRFAAGELDNPVELERADELGILAGAFETMRQRLRASLAEVAEWNHELERRVAARTAEVERLYQSLQARERERAELLQRVIAGQEEERRRLAQELHDEASQALASLQLGLGRLAAGGEGTERTELLAGQLQVVAAQTLAEVHRMAVELRPSVLDDAGLVAAIERCLREVGERGKLTTDFAAVGLDGIRLIQPAETATYRVVQAALTNVVQHARAQHVSVLLQLRAEKLVVVIEDDGEGFDLSTVRAAALEHRLGLAGMEERATLIGAALTFESAPGRGTTVFLEVPLDANGRKEQDREQVAAAVG